MTARKLLLVEQIEQPHRVDQVTLKIVQAHLQILTATGDIRGTLMQLNVLRSGRVE